MTTKTKHVCSCGRALELIDELGYSRTTACPACRRCTLIVSHPNFGLYISLADFHLKRGDKQSQRPLSDLGMATRLVKCLARDEWPSSATLLDFGIDSPEHLGALQHAVYQGITEYELDRVMGDGLAITQLVRGVPKQPYSYVEFRTVYDDFGRMLKRGGA